ncbi:acetamidase [Amniculicola lignicola CBS 123094]|uniref:Acetamidase n=1 Tax=Amniculicola lignicola CBS 123094 TaxID=1392246 RepID=A0A6A5WB55_9PLEO|nr:acetamidase [Amniculicola lignicola CBS 123094]
MATESPPRYKLISYLKKDEQYSRIPSSWLLPAYLIPASYAALSPPDVSVLARDGNGQGNGKGMGMGMGQGECVLDVPRGCGLLTERELRITECDATGVAEGIRRGVWSCREVVGGFCKRAAIAHQLTNCLTEIMFTEAMQRAEELDRHLAEGKPPLGPLHGVPVSVKDTFRVEGVDASIGIASLCFKPSTQNSTLVSTLLSAGAIIHCKTNVPQTLMALDTHNNVFGRTLNPHNTHVTAGGSTGGESALLALKGSALGVGTDIGGSIRIPAMCGGLWGLKGSWERVSMKGVEGGDEEEGGKVGIRASAGPVARSMRDVELFMRTVVGGREWERDADVVPLPWRGLASSPSAGLGTGNSEVGKMIDKKKLRIAIVRRDGIVEPHPPILRVLDSVSTKLQNAGITVEELDLTPLLSQCHSLANALFNVAGSNYMFDLLSSTSEPLSPWLHTRMKRSPALPLSAIQKLLAKRTLLQSQFLQIWKDEKGEKKFDAIITPVAPHAVPPIDRWNSAGYTSSWVLLDYAAGVVPVGVFGRGDMEGEMEGEARGSWDRVNRELWTNFNREIYLNTPLAIQVVAPKLHEEQLCDAMSLISNVLHPPTSASTSPPSLPMPSKL